MPFGLTTEYDDGWIGRFQGIKSDVKSINVNPALSWQVTDNFAIGAGASYQQIKATFTSNVNYSAGIAQAAQAAAAGGQIPAADRRRDHRADGQSQHVHERHRRRLVVGLEHRRVDATSTRTTASVPPGARTIKYDVSGNVDFTNPTMPTLVPAALIPVGQLLANAVNQNPLLANGGVTSSIKLPGIANISWFGHVSDHWDIMADVQWTHWSTVQDLTFVRTNGVLLQSTPENFKDVWRYSLGASYQYDPSWKFRMGVAFDQSPVQDQYLHGAAARQRSHLALGRRSVRDEEPEPQVRSGRRL